MTRGSTLTVLKRQDVVLLTLGEGAYETHVQRLRRVYAALHNAGKRHERECQDARTKQEAADCGLRCIEVRDRRKEGSNCQARGRSLHYVMCVVALSDGIAGAAADRGGPRADAARDHRHGQGGQPLDWRLRWTVD